MDSADSGLVDSLFINFPLVRGIETKFNIQNARRWMGDTFYIAWTAALVYLALVFLGRKWMINRPRYDLRSALFAWNVGLAVFSFIGCISMLPNLVHSIIRNGFSHTTCKTDIFASNPGIILWGFLFCLSKLAELVDTVFIVLRKSNLSFLHWYHHASVLLFAYYTFGRPIQSALEHHYSSINFTVHSIMYTYYALRAADVRLSSKIAQVITVLQISQMFLCMIATTLAYVNYSSGADCNLDFGVLYAAMVLYGSYALLFIQFFVRRYLF